MLEVSTGSRLHFGLLELATGQSLRFGGLGLMLDEPGWTLRFSRGTAEERTAATVPQDVLSRIQRVRLRVQEQSGEPSDVCVQVLRSLPMHSGLGAGTQLAATAAFGFSLFEQLSAAPRIPDWQSAAGYMSIDELIQRSGRGKRSGIGLWGFLHGGLILDEGHSTNSEALTSSFDSTRQLNVAARALHTDWRVVLITPDRISAVAGEHESRLIEGLAETPNPNKSEMHRLAREVLNLAQFDSVFENFVATLQEYVDAAGQLFAASQGGLYNGEPVSEAVRLARQAELYAVGQSSWGPTVYGFAPSQVQAEQAAVSILQSRPSQYWQVRVCAPSRTGACWRWLNDA